MKSYIELTLTKQNGDIFEKENIPVFLLIKVE